VKNRTIICFGEVLWDCLPHGRFLGGAPLNVAYHLRRLGWSPRLVSAVGKDAPGDEILAALARADLETAGVARHPTLPTGTVDVSLDPGGHASYRIARPVAWDAIPSRGPMAEPVAAIVYGSLALRDPANRAALATWMDSGPCLRVCDLNLRPPFDDLEPLGELLAGVDVLKLNIDEARRLVPAAMQHVSSPSLAASLMKRFGAKAVCISCGGDGALARAGGRTFFVNAPEVVVRDTIGAGDAFTAALLDGVLAGGGQVDWGRVLMRACRLGSFVASRDGAQPEYRVEEVLGSRGGARSGDERCSSPR
jgi:fructokinase